LEIFVEDVPGLVDHLFRREAGKMVSYLTKLFGLDRLNLAEDVVQDALCQALDNDFVQNKPTPPCASPSNLELVLLMAPTWDLYNVRNLGHATSRMYTMPTEILRATTRS
jgi:hypothetical protein